MARLMPYHALHLQRNECMEGHPCPGWHRPLMQNDWTGQNMKRDWDLLRKQLTDIEDEKDIFADLPKKTPTWGDGQTQEAFLEDYQAYKDIQGRIFGHLELLTESGFIEGVHLQRGADGMFSFASSQPRLTMAGHDLLDTMRSKPVWQKIKDTAADKGVELTFDTVKALSTVAIKSIFGG